MKRLLTAAVILFLGSVACYANSSDATWKSSNTATTDTLRSICGQNRALLHGVCVNDIGTAGGSVAIFNTRGTNTLPVALMRSTAAITSGCQFFDVQLSSGLTYSNSSNDNITLMYQCY